jgi:methylmalonyl-CoA/ethylmalonyl-CoA epimerase
MVSDTVKKRLRLPRLGQIGYVVTDVSKTMSYYRDTFGVGPWILLDEKPEPCIENGKEVHPVLRIALASVGPVQMELVQVVEGESYHLDHLRESGGGLHHLGFMVRDLDRRLDACKEMGIGILQRGTIRDVGMTVDYAYLDTVDEAGIILEFIQWRMGPIPLPINRLVHNLVCLAGSSTLLKGRVIR